MKKILILILTIFINLGLYCEEEKNNGEELNKEKKRAFENWDMVFYPSFVFGFEQREGTKETTLKLDIRSILLTYKSKKNYFGESGIGLGMGSSLFLLNNECIPVIYMESAYGNYGAFQSTLRCRIGSDNRLNSYLGIKYAYGFMALISELGLDFITIENQKEKLYSISFGLGF